MTKTMREHEGERITPFLKWAGGKRWLVANHCGVFPTQFNRYIEPFLGSGAVYFHLAPARSLLSDINSELITTYRDIRDNSDALERSLKLLQSRHSDDYYYVVREWAPLTPVEKAARFIYLNRTCWNGLYRVNQRGEFNVPRGTKDSVVLNTDDFAGIAKLLKKTSLHVADFEKTIDKAEEGDLLFVDPPYTVKHNLIGDFGSAEFKQYQAEKSDSRYGAANADVMKLSKAISDYVYETLVQIYGTARTEGRDEAYWEIGIESGKAKADAYERQQQSPPDKRLHKFAYLDILPLRDIVKQQNNWPHFQKVFNIQMPDEGKGKKYYLQWMEHFNELRRIPAHPSKHRPYKEADYEFLEWLKSEFYSRLSAA